MNKLTINDIARLCGVGKSTVSRVLNNDANVSPQTKEKVLSVIQQYRFQPSRSARAMRKRESKVIGIIVTRLDSPAENRVLRGMLNELQAQGYEHIVSESRFDVALVQEHLQSFHQRHIDGVVVFAFTGLEQRILEPYRHKLVAIARHYPNLASVYYDDRGAVNLLLERLYQQRHRDISYVGIVAEDYTTGHLRHQAYLDFCRRYQLESHAYLGELDYLTGYTFAPSALQPQTTAIVCATDSLAFGVHKYLSEQQRQDIQVCSVGDNKLLQFLFPNTLTINFGFFRAGQSAVRLLLNVLASPDQIDHHCIHGEFV
ncbi:trehalose operon repressor TreR [Testudinibacter sp. P80/BLE/0925]|uniref:trehalose operon repressor TreR n=1 Tax=Testudinibacter sp. TW-1 TaxID=3417757 RepID=UPI003D364C79